MPDKGWGYIGWSDQYYWGHGRPMGYDRAEVILLQALERPGLEDRSDVLDRLVRLYKEWGKAEKQAALSCCLPSHEDGPLLRAILIVSRRERRDSKPRSHP